MDKPTKSVSEYIHEYKYLEEERNHGYPRVYEPKEDNISDKLGELCYQINVNESPTTRNIISRDYLWTDSGNSFLINVSKESSEKEDYYNRIVKIEQMPPEAFMPSGLTKLLNEKGFVKQP